MVDVGIREAYREAAKGKVGREVDRLRRDSERHSTTNSGMLGEGKEEKGEAGADVHTFRLHPVPHFYCLCVNTCASICLSSLLAVKIGLGVIRQCSETLSFILLTQHQMLLFLY